MALGAGHADYDQTLKRLLTRAHDDVLGFLLPGAQWVEERSPELTSAPRQADLVWEVTLGWTEHLLLHVELQTNPDPLIGERLAEYALRLWRRDRLPVRSIVIYLRESGHRPVPVFLVERGGGEEAFRFRYEAIRLWEEPAERVLGLAEPGLWPLAALMKGEPLATLETVAARLALAPLPRSERGELTGYLAILAGLRVPRPVVEQVLRRNPMIRDLLSESSVVDIFREEGWAAGHEEGHEKGREEGQRTMAQTILESRFGPLEAAEMAALRVAAEPVLRELAVHIATDSREQIRARLGLT